MPSRSDLIAQLRQDVAGLETGLPPADVRVATLGTAELDRALPGGGLLRGVLHEVAPARIGAETAAFGFCAALAHRLAGKGGRPVLWVVPDRSRADLYGPGLAAFGLARGLVVAEARKRPDLLWTMEEGLRTSGLAVVVGEVDRLDLVQGRRLALAAEAGGGSALLLRPGPVAEGEGSVAWTRWRIAPAPSAPGPFGKGFGALRWQVGLARARGMPPADWHVDWDHEAFRFRLAAPLADRPAEAPAAAPWRRAG